MDDENYEKGLKSARIVAFVVLALVIIEFIFLIVTGQMKTATMISGIIQMALLVATAHGMKEKAMYGPICRSYSFNFNDIIFRFIGHYRWYLLFN